MATAYPQSRLHDDFAFNAPPQRDVRASIVPIPMPPWARRLILSMSLVHAVTIIAGLVLGGLYLALGAFGVVMLGGSTALLYAYRDRGGKTGDPSDSGPA